MKLYAKIENQELKTVSVGLGTDAAFYESIGMELMDVEQSEVDGQWYLAENCPHYTDAEKLANAKTEKLAAFSTYANRFDQYKCNEMYVISSIGGYKFNADIRSQTNMQGLIDVMTDDTTLYKDYDNEFRTMTKSDLVTLKEECLKNGQNLYQQKWHMQNKINACKTVDELNAIEIKFEMLDFTTKAS